MSKHQTEKAKDLCPTLNFKSVYVNRKEFVI